MYFTSLCNRDIITVMTGTVCTVCVCAVVYQNEVKRVERELGEYDDELHNETAPARDTGTLHSQLSNVQVR